MDLEDVGALFILILVLAVIVAAAIGLGYLLGNAQCNAQTIGIGFPHRYDFWGGCMVEPNPGQWLPLENWRLIQ